MGAKLAEIRVPIHGTDITLLVETRGTGWTFVRAHGSLGNLDDPYWTDPGMSAEAWDELRGMLTSLASAFSQGLEAAMLKAGLQPQGRPGTSGPYALAPSREHGYRSEFEAGPTMDLTDLEQLGVDGNVIIDLPTQKIIREHHNGRWEDAL